MKIYSSPQNRFAALEIFVSLTSKKHSVLLLLASNLLAHEKCTAFTLELREYRAGLAAGFFVLNLEIMGLSRGHPAFGLVSVPFDSGGNNADVLPTAVRAVRVLVTA